MLLLRTPDAYVQVTFPVPTLLLNRKQLHCLLPIDPTPREHAVLSCTTQHVYPPDKCVLAP